MDLSTHLPGMTSTIPLPPGSPSMHTGRFIETGKSSNENSGADPWEVCNSYAKRHTQELCESWKDEVDKLLIFAGLFSGVVTAFAIESYHSVKEDPTEVAVLMLRTIVLQLDNMTNPRQGTPIDLDPHMDSISDTTKQVNTFWFLSLALSLSTVMAGILCLQWLREYGRNANVPHREDVALHHMRYQGMKKWHVFKILSALPLLLIASLVLFFAGLIEVLWEVDKGAAILVSIVAGAALSFIFMTTLLPTLQCLYICAFPNSRFVQCPYKSPQAWMFQKSLGLLSYFVSRWKSGKIPPTKGSPHFFSDLSKIQSWPEFDRFLRSRRDNIKKQDGRLDVGHGLAWIGETFVQHQKLVNAVCQCLRDLEPRVALEAALARMDRGRAESVRRVWGNKIGPDGPQVQRSLTQDLIVSHTLEHFSEKIEQAHMSPALLKQRLELFLKINEGKGMNHEVECPVNSNNIGMINLDIRLRILSCICTMLKKKLDCNETHTNAALEIIRSILVETPTASTIPGDVTDTLNELLEWVSDKRKSAYDREERLKQAILFHQLIWVCKGEKDRGIVDDYRQGLEDEIKATFGQELDKTSNFASGSRFPYLGAYIAQMQKQ